MGPRQILFMRCAVILLLAVGNSLAAGQVSTSLEDQTFAAARAETVPAKRAAALQNYLLQFPTAAHTESAAQLLLETLLRNSPYQTAAIENAAKLLISRAAPGLERSLEQAHVADQLAGAEDHGVDLTAAHAWAAEAARHLTFETYARESAAEQARFGLPRPSARALHAQFATDRSTALLALANVELQSGNTAEATSLLTEVDRLDPLRAERLLLTAQLMLEQHEAHRALLALVQAAALAPLPPRWQNKLTQLFAEQEHGDAQALEARIDTAYNTLHPPLFALPHRQLAPGGHPVLLELFTGSDCMPCAGPDLALDSLLGSYSRQDLIALEYDEHVPQPDPLATPETAERAGFYAAGATPMAFIDGQPAQLLGTRRQDVENLVVGLADAIEAEAALRSPVHLDLKAHIASDGMIQATEAMTRSDANPAAADLPATEQLSLRTLQRAVGYTALAEDQIRYMGRNGVRFHRMVVRDLRQVPAASLLGGTAPPVRFKWSLSALAGRQGAYLRDFEQHNDRFGTFEFPVREIAIRPDHLVLVAWIQDPLSRQVLDATCVPVSATRP